MTVSLESPNIMYWALFASLIVGWFNHKIGANKTKSMMKSMILEVHQYQELIHNKKMYGCIECNNW